MKTIKHLLIFFLFLNYTTSVFGQEKISEDTSIYAVFNQFFDKEIKKQGIKGDWIFMLNEITGKHNFDFNNDTFIDVLFEFNAVPIDGGSYTLYFIVLFKNIENNTFEFVDYLENENLKFSNFYNNTFVFDDLKSKISLKYNISNSKFIKIHEQ